MNPPSLPWKRGKNKNYSCFNLEIQICEDLFGRVWSSHDFQDFSDKEIALSLKHGGVEQIAFALLTETLRREIFVAALIRIQENSKFIENWKEADPESKLNLEKEVAKAASKNIEDMLVKMSPGCSREIFNMLSSTNQKSF